MHTKALTILVLATAASWGQVHKGTPTDPAEARAKQPAPVQAPVAVPPPKLDRGGSSSDVASTSPAEPTARPLRDSAQSQGRPPLANLRYEMPQDIAPQVGYAAVESGPLPAYPGVAMSNMALPGNPGVNMGVGPLTKIFTDTKAAMPGDVVTIVVTQSAVAAANADKSAERSATASGMGGSGIFSFLPKLGLALDAKQSGKSGETGNFSLATTFTALVTAVKPNGNLMLEGSQTVTMDGRPQHLKMTGEVRPYDISADNTVPSTKVANVTLKWDGLRSREHRNIFDRAAGFIERLFGSLF